MANEMDYKCRLCSTTFEDLNEIIKHLKSTHEVKEKRGKIQCCVNRISCQNYYFTFSGLRNHAKQCIKTRYSDDKTHLEIPNEISPNYSSNVDVANEIQKNTSKIVRTATLYCMFIFLQSNGNPFIFFEQNISDC